MFRHPVIARASSTFILCGLASSASQLFIDSNLDPDKSIRFAVAGSFSIVPIWFGWTHLLNESSPILKRIALEAFLFGPMYLASMLWWSSTLADQRVSMNSVRTVRERLLPLYIDALKVVPLYNALVWFAVAPPMRGYALTGCQFFWNIYLAWFIDNSISPKGALHHIV